MYTNWKETENGNGTDQVTIEIDQSKPLQNLILDNFLSFTKKLPVHVKELNRHSRPHEPVFFVLSRYSILSLGEE